MTSKVGVFYLAWAGEDVSKFMMFADSYASHPAGARHELIVLCKGISPVLMRKRLDGRLSHASFEPTPDTGLDIHAYLRAAGQHPHAKVVFFNSNSVLLADGWLDKMLSHLDSDGVGLVGATGSWESVLSNHVAEGKPPKVGTLGGRVLRAVHNERETRRLKRRFHGFPNPHLRTNAFCIDREMLLGVPAITGFGKSAASAFEAGRQGLSNYVIGQGMRLVVIGKDGRPYETEEWPASRTFRSGDQENLLVADNRTKQYQKADTATRLYLATLAWGSDPDPDSPPDLPGAQEEHR